MAEETTYKAGQIIDLGNGQQGLVIDPKQFPPQEIAAGFAMLGKHPSNVFDRNGFLETDFSALMSRAAITNVDSFNLKFFTDTPTGLQFDDTWIDDANTAMVMAQRHFVADSKAGKIIELMAQFSIDGAHHQLGDDKVKQFYDHWFYDIGFQQVLNQIFLNYYLYGNVYVLKTLVNFKQQPIDPNYKYQVDPNIKSPTGGGKATAALTDEQKAEIKAIDETYETALAAYLDDKIPFEEMHDLRQNLVQRALAAQKHVWSKSMIPGNYTMLDPTAIKLKGPANLGLAELTYQIGYDLQKAIKEPTKQQKQILLGLPKDFVRQVKEGVTNVVLDPNIVSEIHRMKLDFKPLSHPLMSRAFRAMHMKNRLREMEASVINNVIGQLLVIKVGDKDYPATKSQMESLKDAYISAVQSKSLVLVWNHTLQVERVPVDIGLLDPKKYQVWDNDICDAFGVSPILLGKIEGTATSAYVSVKGFIENLEQGRQDVLTQFVYPEYHGIALAQGFKGYPELVFDKFNLSDESQMVGVMIKLVQAGILDYQTVVEELGYSYKQVLQRNTEQAPLKDNGVIRMASPYQPAPAPGTDSQTGGRPSGSSGGTGSQPNKRPKDKNVGTPTK